MPISEAELKRAYESVKTEVDGDIVSDRAGRAIHDFAILSLRFLQDECVSVPLKSLVPSKEFHSYGRSSGELRMTRPANNALFLEDAATVSRLWQAWWDGAIDRPDLARMSYTIALAPCLALEIFDRQNKKGPATYFECLIGHIFAKTIGVNPSRTVRLPIAGSQVAMTMDFLFDLGADTKSVHLPVKMSTRERVVQAWAHQRMLDAAFGGDKYRGILVCFSETKLDLRKREVVEICVPEQWLAYQSLLAKLDRIYYFDVPVRYQQMTDKHPELLVVKEFAEFFRERAVVLSAT